MDDSTLLKDGFRFLEGLTHADYAFEAIGKNLSELFLHSAKALIAAMADVKTIQAKDTQTLKDAESFIPAQIIVNISSDEGIYHLECTLKGEEIDSDKHRLENDVKAVTYHLLEVKHNSTWTVQILFDI